MSVQRDLGARPELTWLPIDRLAVNEDYQRSLDTPGGKRLIAKIADNFHWSAFQAILATPDGNERWLIIDGQHRVAAARQLGLALVPAVVIQQATVADQAGAFVSANRDRVPVSAQALYHARVLAGDADAVTLARLCRAAGIEVLRYNQGASTVPAGKTAAVPGLLRLLRGHGETIAGRAINAIAECYGKDVGALRSPFFLAAGKFLADGGGDQELKYALTRVGWRELEAVGLGLGGYTMITDMVAKLRAATKPVIVLAPNSPPQTAPLKAGPLPGKPSPKGFADDPRAKADHGSTDRLPLTSPFGRSEIGSSLA